MEDPSKASTLSLIEFRRITECLRQSLGAFLGFEILFRLLNVALFGPIVALLTAYIISLSGDGVVSNFDLTGFFLSPTGLLFLFVTITLAFALFFFEYGGLTALSIASLHGRKLKLLSLLWWLGRALPRLWRLSLQHFLVLLAVLVPALLGVGVTFLLFLTGSDIYFYLQMKPPEFWIAAAIVGLIALALATALLYLGLRWLICVPLVLLTGSSAGEAMRESRRLTTPHRSSILKHLLLWLGISGLLMGASWLLTRIAEASLFGIAPDNVGWMLFATALIAAWQLLLSTISATCSMAFLSIGGAQLFIRLRPEIALPDFLQKEPAAPVAQRAKRSLSISLAILLIMGVGTTFIATKIVNKMQFHDDVGITAHRGSSLRAPENTMAAILLAIEEGVDYVEIDVQSTRDGVVVLAHDRDLRRVFDIRKNIWEVSYDEIRDLDSGGWFSPDFSDQRISTLDEVIEAVRGNARLNIEVKFNGPERGFAEAVVDIVGQQNFEDECIVTSLDYAGLQRVQAANPNLRTGIIVSSSLGDILKMDVDLLSIDTGTANSVLIRSAHQAEREVHVWTVNEASVMNTMIGKGVDQIITDDPKLLGEVMEERAGLSNAEKALLQLADIARHGLRGAGATIEAPRKFCSLRGLAIGRKTSPHPTGCLVPLWGMIMAAESIQRLPLTFSPSLSQLGRISD